MRRRARRRRERPCGAKTCCSSLRPVAAAAEFLPRAPYAANLGATAAFDAQGVLWATHKDGGHIAVSRSDDAGRTWSKPENLTRALKKEAWWLLAPARQAVPDFRPQFIEPMENIAAFFRVALLGGAVVGRALLEERILFEFLLDVGGEFEVRELQQLDRLLQLRSHRQGLA